MGCDLQPDYVRGIMQSFPAEPTEIARSLFDEVVPV